MFRALLMKVDAHRRRCARRSRRRDLIDAFAFSPPLMPCRRYVCVMMRGADADAPDITRRAR
jgi:hypothetical protein